MTAEAKIQALLDKQIRGNVYNVVAGVHSGDGRIDFVGAAGLADRDSGTAMTPDTPYALASITKMYTASVILKLHEQGLLDIDAAMAEYLPAALIEGIHADRSTDYSRQIKVYHLINQTSGLPDYFLDKLKGGRSVFDELKAGHDRYLSIEDIAEIVRGLPPKFAPGAADGGKAHYADTNYRLLGAIAESVTGQSLADVFQQMIFTPLNLTHTCVYTAELEESDARPATIYLKDQPVHLPQFFSSHVPDGGIIATAADSLTFLRAFFGGQLFDPGWFERMTRRWNPVFFPMQYGYGMMRVNLPRAFSPFKPVPAFVGHSGSTGTFAYYCPERDLYLAGAVNQIADPSRPIRLMMQIANLAKS